MKQAVRLGGFASGALTGVDERCSEAVLRSRLVSAIRFYLNQRDSGQPGWPYPRFIPGTGKSDEVKLELDVEADLWRAFEEEAVRQGVSVSQLASHAVLYYAAERDAGRFARRIADGLEDESA